VATEKGTYPVAAVVTASKNMVCVVGHAGHGAKNAWDTTHGMREVTRGKEKIKMCKIYTDIVCTDHVEIFKERAYPVFKNKTFDMPHHIYYTPTGEELFRNAGTKTAPDLIKDFEAALAKVQGKHLSKDDYNAAKGNIATAAAHIKKDEIKKAIAIFNKLAKDPNELLQPMGTRELDGLEASGNARVDAAIQTLTSNEEEGKKELKKVAEEYGPLPCSKKAAEVLRLMAEKGR
jgi:hypothetical protein